MHFWNIIADSDRSPQELSEYVFKNKKYLLLHTKINIEIYHGVYTVHSGKRIGTAHYTVS